MSESICVTASDNRSFRIYERATISVVLFPFSCDFWLLYWCQFISVFSDAFHALISTYVWIILCPLQCPFLLPLNYICFWFSLWNFCNFLFFLEWKTPYLFHYLVFWFSWRFWNITDLKEPRCCLSISCCSLQHTEIFFPCLLTLPHLWCFLWRLNVICSEFGSKN